MSDKLAQFLARRAKSPAALFADGVRDAAAAARRGDEAAARAALAALPVEEVMNFTLPQVDGAARAAAGAIGRGQAASPGAASGILAFSAPEALAQAAAGKRVILARLETDAGDMEAIRRCAGVLTTTGGMTSHAAVVARGWGRPCVSGAAGLRIDARRRVLFAGSLRLTATDSITIDGGSGDVFAGALPIQSAAMSDDLREVLALADRVARMKVLANADSPADAALARQMGAQGVGLCRTEHMFFEPRRLLAIRRMILAETPKARAAALKKMLPWQRRDFVGVLRAMDGLPVTIRLIDPPLHEFLTEDRRAQAELAQVLKIPLKQVQSRVASLRETNPMLGHRGCRLCVTYPEILQMQVRAIVEAALECHRAGGDPRPRILHPLVGAAEELKLLRRLTEEAIAEAKADIGDEVPEIPIGTMIEVPRAALVAGALAAHADFFSFGTNDLTQLTYGYCRDDYASFLPRYMELGVLSRDPFESLDTTGVGELITLAMQRGRAVKPQLPGTLCGEHGGDADSIRFGQTAGLDAVSCSPFRVPLARLAAGQAALQAS